MDIAAVSCVLSQSKTNTAANLLIMKKALDTMDENGQAMLNILAASEPALPHLGNNVDLRI